jgi:hypothetical protein
LAHRRVRATVAGSPPSHVAQPTAHPDEVEGAVQRMIAGQSFDALSKSSEHELMQ